MTYDIFNLFLLLGSIFFALASVCAGIIIKQAFNDWKRDKFG